MPAKSVRHLSDILQLYKSPTTTNLEYNQMGYPRKTRAATLNRIIEFIWSYQQTHHGDTPTTAVSARELELSSSSLHYYLGVLAESGRIDRVSIRPPRIFITQHPLNLEVMQTWVAKQPAVADAQLTEKRAALQSTVEPAANVPSSSAENVAVPAQPTPLAEAINARTALQAQLTNTTEWLKPNMRDLLPLTDTRDLIFELISRGYAIEQSRR